MQCTKTHNGTVTGNFEMKEVADEDGGLAHALDAISSLKTGGRLLRVGCIWSLSLLVAAIAQNHYKIHDRFALSKPDCGLLLSQKGGFIYILSYPPAGFRLCSFGKSHIIYYWMTSRFPPQQGWWSWIIINYTTNTQTDNRADTTTYRWMDGRTDGRMDGWMCKYIYIYI